MKRPALKTPIAAGVLLLALALGFFIRPISYLNEYQYLRLWMAGSESRNVEVAGIRIHYDVVGPANGPAIVLIHGLGGNAENWKGLAPSVSQAGYRVYMPDLPGYGRSEWPTNFSYSVRDQATVVMQFFDAMGLKQADLGGSSMGGWIVQLVAAEYPERVRRLLIFDSVGINFQPDWDTNLFMPTNAQQMDELDALLMPHPPKIPGFIMRDILRLAHQQDWVIHRALVSMLSGKDLTDVLLPTLKMPVLLIWGEEDRIAPLAVAQKMQQLIPQSELDVFPGCGHMAPRNCADQIAPRVVEFMKR